MENNELDTTVPQRNIHTFVIRAGRMTEAQKRDYHIHSARWCLPFTTSIVNFTDIFENTYPVTIEIGFGMGSATAEIAQNNPDKNYLGLEVHKAGVGRLLGEIEKRGLTNIRIIEYDALEVLSYMIPDESIAAFHIFFPDPWPKKKHFKRRLLTRPRTSLLAKKLSHLGYVYMVTDWEPYGQHACSELTATENLENMYEEYAPPQLWRPETRFEQKGKQAKHDIFELLFKKV